MTLQEAIFYRASRRNYLQTSIEPLKLQILQDRITSFNQKAGLSMMLMENGSEAFNGFSKSYGMFRGVRSLIVFKGKASDENLKEKCGYYGEYIVLEATRLGLGTCWVGGTFDKRNAIFDINEGEEFVCVITIGNVIEKLSFKENMIWKINHRKERSLESFYIAEETPPHWFLKGIEAVKKAPSAVNRQKYKFTYNGTVSAYTEDTIQYAMIDLGIAKAHFSIAANGRFELGNNGIFRPHLIAENYHLE